MLSHNPENRAPYTDGTYTTIQTCVNLVRGENASFELELNISLSQLVQVYIYKKTFDENINMYKTIILSLIMETKFLKTYGIQQMHQSYNLTAHNKLL